MLIKVLFMLEFNRLISCFCLSVSLSGCETKLVQLAVFPLLTAVMADGSEDSEWPVWDRSPVLLCFSQEAILL